MHDQARDFTMFVKQILGNYFINKRVLDVGSGDINGNNRFLFENCEYDGKIYLLRIIHLIPLYLLNVLSMT